MKNFIIAKYLDGRMVRGHTLDIGNKESFHLETEQGEHLTVTIADLKAGPLAHLPSGRFAANAAWLVAATIAHTLTRAVGVLAGGQFARAETATVRARIVTIPARLARSARRLHLHLPQRWPWPLHWQWLWTAVMTI